MSLCLVISGCSNFLVSPEDVMAEIDKIGEVTLEDAEQIDYAISLYEKLSERKREEVENYDVLTKANHTLNMLQVDDIEESSDDSSDESEGKKDHKHNTTEDIMQYFPNADELISDAEE